MDEDREKIIERLKGKYKSMAEPIESLEYSKENYDKLFPKSEVDTPIGKVTLRNDQFEKLRKKENEGREDLLAPMNRTLRDPITIRNQQDNRGKTFLFDKSFKNEQEKVKMIQSVVMDIKGRKVGISTHQKDMNNILNKINGTEDVIYEKSSSSAHIGPKSDSSDGYMPSGPGKVNLTHLPETISPIGGDVNTEGGEKMKRLAKQVRGQSWTKKP